ncbi:MAG: AMP-binding protein [Myxococcota bacterium]
MTEAPTFDAPFTLGEQIEARGDHPATAEKVLLVEGDRSWTYRQFRDESVRTAQFLLRRLGRSDERRPGHVAMLLENHLELLSLFGGCGYAGLTLFGVNPSLRGETLAGVINHSRARLLVVDQRFYPEVERIRGQLKHVPAENLLVRGGAEAGLPAELDLERRLADEVAESGATLSPPDVPVEPDRNLMVIYTSGTTGLPKGINNDHLKLCTSGLGIGAIVGIGPDDRGYACMPLFHSNSMFMGFMGSFWCGASLALRERFSASAFVEDVLRYGVTYWNYVGEPVHYVLSAVEKQFGGEEQRIRAELTENPRNRLRFAVGNGASPPDIDRFSRWFGLEEVHELYGSTEAAISSFRRKGDPRGSTGEIADPHVKILREDGGECPPAQLDERGRVANYAEAIGEICRVAPDAGLFQGYFDNPEANAAKYHDGVFHSGDLGHVLVREGKRYLFFDGRTDDWIRKDGENFSTAQVARLLSEHPSVQLAVAYGVPCAVSDELVMAALELREGARFDPREFFEFCERLVEQGSMDRKWVPDFVRIVESFDYTATQKVLVRNLKRAHFRRDPLSEAPIYWRQRGDSTFRAFSERDYRALRREFERAEKLELLER